MTRVKIVLTYMDHSQDEVVLRPTDSWEQDISRGLLIFKREDRTRQVVPMSNLRSWTVYPLTRNAHKNEAIQVQIHHTQR